MHQVEVKAAQRQRLCQFCGADGLFRTMNTAQTLQLLRTETLYTNRNTVDTGTLISAEPVSFHGARIGFHGHFRIRGERQTRPHAIHQHLHRTAAQQAGRTAANENRAHFPAIDQRQVDLQIAQQVLHVFNVRHLIFQRMGVKIAVGTLLYAPRNVDVET